MQINLIRYINATTDKHELKIDIQCTVDRQGMEGLEISNRTHFNEEESGNLAYWLEDEQGLKIDLSRSFGAIPTSFLAKLVIKPVTLPGLSFIDGNHSLNLYITAAQKDSSGNVDDESKVTHQYYVKFKTSNQNGLITFTPVPIPITRPGSSKRFKINFIIGALTYIAWSLHNNSNDPQVMNYHKIVLYGIIPFLISFFAINVGQIKTLLSGYTSFRNFFNYAEFEFGRDSFAFFSSIWATVVLSALALIVAFNTYCYFPVTVERLSPQTYLSFSDNNITDSDFLKPPVNKVYTADLHHITVRPGKELSDLLKDSTIALGYLSHDLLHDWWSAETHLYPVVFTNNLSQAYSIANKKSLQLIRDTIKRLLAIKTKLYQDTVYIALTTVLDDSIAKAAAKMVNNLGQITRQLVKSVPLAKWKKSDTILFTSRAPIWASIKDTADAQVNANADLFSNIPDLSSQLLLGKYLAAIAKGFEGLSLEEKMQAVVTLYACVTAMEKMNAHSTTATNEHLLYSIDQFLLFRTGTANHAWVETFNSSTHFVFDVIIYALFKYDTEVREISLDKAEAEIEGRINAYRYAAVKVDKDRKEETETKVSQSLARVKAIRQYYASLKDDAR